MSKILWLSNAPWVGSGYGEQTATFVPRLAELGHDMAVAANYGLQGQIGSWQGFPVYPDDGAWGNKRTGTYAKHFNADLVIALCDAWVMKPHEWDNLEMAIWAPIDHHEVPPVVYGALAHERVRAIAMSRFGEQAMQRAKLDPVYVPHGCFDYGAQVSLGSGGVAKLGDLVAGVDPACDVLGVDAAGRVCSAKILDRMILPLMDDCALSVTTRSGRNMVITKDNEVMTSSGWKRAGNLLVSDLLATVCVDGHIQAMDCRRDGVAQNPLRILQQRGHPERTAWTVVGCDTHPSKEAAGRALSLRASGVYKAVAPSARTVCNGVGLFRGPDRRRGPHQLDPFKSPKRRPVFAQGWADESIGTVDRMGRREDCLDYSVRSSEQGRLGMGLSPSRRGAPSSFNFGGHAALPCHQAEASGSPAGVLLKTGDRTGNVSSKGTWREHLSEDALTECPEGLSLDPIVSIAPVSLETVYDLKTSTGNFFVDGILVHNCDTSLFAPRPELKAEVRKELDIPEDAFLVGMVAANKSNPSLPRKAFPQAFHAFSRFAKDHPDAYLYVHTQAVPDGGGGMPLDKVAVATGCPEGRVRFPPDESWHLPQPRELVAKIYQAFDVLLNPSMGEGFGIPILEAQASGVPVIASDHSAMTELAQAGWLVGGDPWWDALQDSFLIVPAIDSILAALEASYEARDDQKLRDAAVGFARTYDADLVTEEYWKPALEKLAEPRKSRTVAPLNGFKPNRAMRRAQAKVKA